MGTAGEERVWQVRPRLLYRALVDGGMVYDGESGQVHHLNATAALVWERCQGGATSAELADSLCSRYAVEMAQARADVGRIIQQLADARLLEP